MFDSKKGLTADLNSFKAGHVSALIRIIETCQSSIVSRLRIIGQGARDHAPDAYNETVVCILEEPQWTELAGVADSPGVYRTLWKSAKRKLRSISKRGGRSIPDTNRLVDPEPSAETIAQEIEARLRLRVPPRFLRKYTLRSRARIN
jgi:hypothetical protein